MRVPIPKSFRVRHVVIFAIAVFLIQLLEGTDFYFASLLFAYILIFALSYNIAGGLDYASGAFIFFNGTLTLIVGMVYKLFLFEPGQSNLQSPILTMEIYCAGMFALGTAAYFTRKLRTRRGLLADMSTGKNMKLGAIGSVVLGIALNFAVRIIGNEEGSLGSALGQLNRFVAMGIILATTYEINSTNGKRSTNWIVWMGGIWTFATGVIGFSKEGMLTGPFCWMLPAIALRYDFRPKQLAIMALATFVLLQYLVPFSQYGRNYRDENGKVGADFNTALTLLSHPEETRQQYKATVEDIETQGPHLYDTTQGLFDRLQMVAIDDALIHFTDQGQVYGLQPVIDGFLNSLPRVIYKNKETRGYGNVYARELGVISSEDTTTGISFSPAADAYHEATWFGVLVIMPMVLFLVFFVCDSVCGSVESSPWGLLLITLFAHIAPEGSLGGPIYVMVYGTESIVAVALLARYALPILAGILTGGERARVEKTRDFAMASKPVPVLLRICRQRARCGLAVIFAS